MPHARSLALVPILLVLIGACSALFGGTPPNQHAYLVKEKHRVKVPWHYESLTMADFLALPSLPATYSEGDWKLVRAHTRRAVSLEGYLAEIIPAPDGDIHLHLRDTQQPRCFPDGAPGTQVVTEVTPPFQPPKTGWSLEALGALCQQQVRVRLSGWLLHDYAHLRDVGDWRATVWEIHPVTKIEVWNADHWQDLP